MRMLIVFCCVLRANEIRLVLCIIGVMYVACFTSSLVFLSLKTSDLAFLPRKKLKRPPGFLYMAMRMFSSEFLILDPSVNFLGFRLSKPVGRAPAWPNEEQHRVDG